MTTTEIALQGDSTVATAEQNTAIGQLMQHAQAMQTAYELAKAMCGSDLVPVIYKGKPENGAAAILYGAELGLNPIQSLQQIFVVKGNPAIYARTMVALLKSKGHRVWTEDTSDEAVTVCGQLKGDDHVERSTWSIDRAKKAGYTSNTKYQSDPQAMLFAKAASEVCRKIAPDILLGIAYSREELELEPRTVRVPSERVPSAPVTASEILGTKAAEPESAPTDVSDLPEVEPEATADQAAEPEVPQVEGSTVAQQRKIAILLGNEKIDDRQAKLDYLETQFGRKFTSSKELTKDEASNLIEFLSSAQAADGEQGEIGGEQ